MKIVFLAIVIFGEAALPMRARGAPETFAARPAPLPCATAAKKGDFYMESRRPGGVLKNRFSDSPSGMRNAIMDVKY